MPLGTLVLRNLQQKLTPVGAKKGLGLVKGVREQKWNSEIMKRFMATDIAKSEKTSDEKSLAKEVSDKESGSKFKSFSKRDNPRRSLYLNSDMDAVPADLYELIPSGMASAIGEATRHLTRVFDALNLLPRQLTGQLKETDDNYKLRFEVPGLTKDEVKIRVHDGILTVKGEWKESDSKGNDDDNWWWERSGYYKTASLVLPEDANFDELKAELKDGVLFITIPRTEKPKRVVKEIKIN